MQCPLVPFRGPASTIVCVRPSALAGRRGLWNVVNYMLCSVHGVLRTQQYSGLRPPYTVIILRTPQATLVGSLAHSATWLLWLPLEGAGRAGEAPSNASQIPNLPPSTGRLSTWTLPGANPHYRCALHPTPSAWSSMHESPDKHQSRLALHCLQNIQLSPPPP
jgi:hypothetical protein